MKLNIVPAYTGVKWVQPGASLFWRQPMALSALFFMTMAAMFGQQLPLVGPGDWRCCRRHAGHDGGLQPRLKQNFPTPAFERWRPFAP